MPRSPVCKLDRPFRTKIQERKEGLRKPCKIPLRDLRLISIGVAPQFIDRAKRLRWIVRIRGKRTVQNQSSRLKAPCCRCSSRRG